MSKIALIKNVTSPEWQSCKTISQNLLASYEKLKDHELEIFDYPQSGNLIEINLLAEKVSKSRPDTIVWLEYKPTPTSFLNALDRFYEKENRPQLVFHIYGDFVLNIKDWANLEGILKKYSSKFLVASEKQKILLEKFMEGSGLVEVCPFPVDKDNFSYDSSLRAKKRKELALKEDEILILYSGRLSYQKNIYHTLYSIREFIALSSQKVRFLMAGPMDDLGMPYIGRSGPLGAFYGQFIKAKDALKEYFETGTFLNLGDVSQQELRELYCASDILINLSTHNDEDYGMAPAEALCCGCPAVLSNWGGFASFKTMLPKDVRLVNLKIEKNRFLPSYSMTVKELLKFEVYDDEMRNSLSKRAQEQIGVSRCSQVISKELSSSGSFNSFTSTFKRLLACFENVPNGPFKSPKGQLSGFYFEIYNDYGGVDEER